MTTAFSARRALLLSFALAASAAAAPTSQPANGDELTPEALAAIDRGLAWLSTHQAEDGSYGAGSQYGRHVGITGLAGLAFIADGDLPGRGRYAINVQRSLDFVLRSTAPQSGLIAAET